MIYLIQQIFGFLRVAGEIPLVRLLRVHDTLPGLLAESLGRGEIRVPSRGDVCFGTLRDGNTAHEQQAASQK